MKKILYLVAIALILSSCKKEVLSPASLIGTSWTYHPDGKHYETIEFLNGSEVFVTGNLNGGLNSKSGTYTYDKNYVFIDLRTELKAGSVIENSMYLQDPIWSALYPETAISFEYVED